MQHTTSKPGERLLRRPEVIQRVGMGTSAIYAGMKNGTFPVCLKLSSRCSVWPASLIDSWIAERIAGAPHKS